MADVKFLKGTRVSFDALSNKDDSTFYFITDEKELYLGADPISGVTELQTLKDSIGDLTTLKTTDKTALVKAINEIFDKLTAEEAASKITIEKDTTGLIYKIRQGTAAEDNPESNVVGTIDIPKDMVVKSGEIVDITAGEATTERPAGKYIKLTLANAEAGKDEIYIPVNALVDAYTAASGATHVQLAISASNEISASIVANSITSNELATNAVTTDKILNDAVTDEKIMNGSVTTDKISDKAVTRIKLSQELQDVIAGMTWGTF